jgi:hypothetical protein
MRRNVDRDRRVVVTGLGLVTPLGTGIERNWEALMAGRSGVGLITRFDTSDYPTKIAGEIPDFDPLDWIEKRDVRKMDLFIQYAMGAAEQAMRQSGLKITEANADDVGVLVGVGIGGLNTIEENHMFFLDSRLKRVTPFFIPKLILWSLESQKVGDQRFNFIFEQLFRACRHNKVVGIPNHVHLIELSKPLAKFQFQPVQRNVGQRRRDDSALRGSRFGRP